MLMRLLFFLCLALIIIPEFSHADHGQDTSSDALYITAIEPETLTHEEPNLVKLYFQNEEGEAIGIEEFEVIHTEPIHLLIIEPNLEDYHHKHPQELEKGTYHFTLSPTSACNYKIWVDVKRKDKAQQYIPVSLKGSENCTPNINKVPSLSASTAGYNFDLKIDEALKAGEHITATLNITKDGQPVSTLEPLMGAFAHLVGFYDDYETIAHIHPLGKEPESDNERGGPELKFHLSPEKAGFLKLFAQVKVKDVEIFVPFSLVIEE